MDKWYFPSRDYAETEGFSNAGLADFKGNPLQALAREICQNSLDAADGSGKPVRVEFHKCFMEKSLFPGMDEMKTILDACQDFWGRNGDSNTRSFLSAARKSISSDKFFVLRISDFNTKGVQGAFSDNNITPWGSLVKGNSFSVKTDEKNAAGSYGIGKAAPFVSSYYQTVFYRTYDIDEVRAALGVARLMAFITKSQNLKPGEDPIRRSVGYYGVDSYNKPAHAMQALDQIYKRTEHGTDIFIPGFCCSTSNDEWIRQILTEVVDNFLYSIYIRKLEVVVENRSITRDSLPNILSYLGTKAKHANMFYEVIRQNNTEVIEQTTSFHGIGTLRLRLLYANDMNKKVLVVRNSGMRISSIPSLPRGVSYVGFLEIQGDKLNQFFRDMENPKHNLWEPKRHNDPITARQYKEEVEEWVRTVINEKIVEISGDESLIDVEDCFIIPEAPKQKKAEAQTKESLVDTVKSIDIIEDVPVDRRFKVRDIGGKEGTSNEASRSGVIDDVGSRKGHRTRTGTKTGGAPTGRAGYEEQGSSDKIYPGKREVYVSARIISLGNGLNRLFFTAEDSIENGEMEIVTRGENGRTLQLYVLECSGGNTRAVDGHIVISGVPAGIKQVAEFRIAGKRTYAMGVKAYGN